MRARTKSTVHDFAVIGGRRGRGGGGSCSSNGGAVKPSFLCRLASSLLLFFGCEILMSAVRQIITNVDLKMLTVFFSPQRYLIVH